MTHEEFIDYWLDYFHAHPEQRAGQALFNALYLQRSDLSEQIRGTALDPFHQNTRLTQTQEWIKTNW